jgi:replicative DNA helicase
MIDPAFLPAGARDGVRSVAPLVADVLLDDVRARALEAQAARRAGRQTAGIPTGLPGVDRRLNGLRNGCLYVLGGAPGVGKTTLALQFACHAAAEMGRPVLYVTFENLPENLVLKAVCRLGGVSPTAVERGVDQGGAFLAGIEAFARLAPRIAFVHGSNLGSLLDLEEQARQITTPNGAGPSLIVIDYLQRMAYRQGLATLKENLSALALGLHEVAGRLHSVVFGISSLSRDVAESTTRHSRP